MFCEQASFWLLLFLLMFDFGLEFDLTNVNARTHTCFLIELLCFEVLLLFFCFCFVFSPSFSFFSFPFPSSSPIDPLFGSAFQ